MTTGHTAETISVSQTLELFDTQLESTVTGIENRTHVLWLGSGISRDVVDDLPTVIRRVLSHLQLNANFGDEHCPFNHALTRAIALAKLGPDELQQLDQCAPVEKWPLLGVVLNRLQNEYASLLDILIDDKREDYMVWDAVDVCSTFASDDLEPDCEHLCIALLILEGIFENVVTANWDPLVERASSTLSDGNDHILRVCVSNEDFRENQLRTRLYKIHGCADRAKSNEKTFRKLLVGRRSQITQWPEDPAWGQMRAHLVNLSATKPTLMIGLSAQDENIQNLFTKAQASMQWTWPTDPPACVFSADQLGDDQVNLLRSVYKEHYHENRDDIDEHSLVQAYAKPLLVALVLHVLCQKLTVLMRLSENCNLSQDDYWTLDGGLKYLRDSTADHTKPDRAFVESLIAFNTFAINQLNSGGSKQLPQGMYVPLSPETGGQLAATPAFAQPGMPQFAAALSLLGLGAKQGSWALKPGNKHADHEGVLEVVSADDSKHRLHFVSNSDVALRLIMRGVVGEMERDAIIIYSTAPAIRAARNPRPDFGRTGILRTRELDMGALLTAAANVGELQARFKEESAL